MTYPKKVVIQQIRHKYKITEKQAEKVYNEYKQSDNLDVLASVIFKSDNAYTTEPTALSY